MTIVPTPITPLSSARPEAGSQQSEQGYATLAARYPEFIAELRALRSARRAAMARLRHSTRRKQRDQVRQLLVSRDLHLFYAYEGLRKAGQLGTATPSSIRELAARCDPFSLSAGGVTRHEVIKRGRCRTVDLYSPFKRMQQALVADLIRNLHPPRPEQYLFNGGMPKALAAIEAAYRSGWHWAVQVDLVDFYGSVRFDGLAELLRPLPASVVEHVVWDASCRRAVPVMAQQGVVHACPSLNGSPGLSLGSATSPIVGETIVGRVLAQLPSGEQTMTYADNILVFGRERDEASARAQSLVGAFGDNPEMPLRSRAGATASFAPEKLVADPSLIGVEFAHQVANERDGKLYWSPVADRRLDYFAEDITPSMTMVEVVRMENRVARWRRAYPTWEEGQKWETECLALLACVRYFREPQPLHLAAAINAVIAAMVAWRGDHGIEQFLPDTLGNRDYERRHATLTREVTRFLAGDEEPVAA